MEHLFKFLLLAPYFYFDNWIEKANRNSKFFPIFYYFYWVYIPLYSLFSLAWTVVSVLFFNIVLRNVTDIKFWGIWFLFILLAIGLNWLTYSCFKKMFRLRRELGKSKGGRHWFILFENLFKPRQRRLSVGICYWLRQFYPQPQNSVLSWLCQFYLQLQSSALSNLRLVS